MNIVNKLKNAKEGEFIFDPKTGVTYQITAVDKNGGMPCSIAK